LIKAKEINDLNVRIIFLSSTRYHGVRQWSLIIAFLQLIFLLFFVLKQRKVTKENSRQIRRGGPLVLPGQRT